MDVSTSVIISTALSVLAAFCLGACPFSVWVGRRMLNKDIRSYGDGNPGAVNVFRAGGRKTGLLAVLLDVVKGVPFVLLAYTVLKLPDTAVAVVALGAILGHAFSPLLGGHGGKAIAVTFGTMLALPQHEILFAFVIFLLIGVFFIAANSWAVIFGATGALAYLAITRSSTWELLFMVVTLTILVIKHFDDLRTFPGVRVRLIHWIQSRR